MDSYIFEIDTWGENFVDSAAAPHYCTLGGIAKANEPPDAPNVVFNEFVCARLAAMLGLPVPPGVLAKRDDGTLVFVSLRVGKKGDRPPPVIPARLIADHPDVAAGVVAFDCWVYNDDRHDENVAYLPTLGPPVVFDHDHALLGEMPTTPDELLARRDTPCVERCLPPEIESEEHFVPWCDQIAALDEGRIRGVCSLAAAAGVTTPELATAAGDFLVYRKDKVRGMLRASSDAFPKIQWSVL